MTRRQAPAAYFPSLANTFSEDGHLNRIFDYMLSNPPFGVEWQKVEREIRKEHETQGFISRFGPRLPRVSDRSLLFLLHLFSKMRPAQDGGSRFGIVLNGSPTFHRRCRIGEQHRHFHLCLNRSNRKPAHR